MRSSSRDKTRSSISERNRNFSSAGRSSDICSGPANTWKSSASTRGTEQIWCQNCNEQLYGDKRVCRAFFQCSHIVSCSELLHRMAGLFTASMSRMQQIQTDIHVSSVVFQVTRRGDLVISDGHFIEPFYVVFIFLLFPIFMSSHLYLELFICVFTSLSFCLYIFFVTSCIHCIPIHGATAMTTTKVWKTWALRLLLLLGFLQSI